MRKITSIIMFLMFSVLLFSEGAVLRNISGKVEVSNNGNGNWRKATEGMTVELSDTISTGFGAAATLDLGYSKVALKPLTRMSVDMFLETKNKVSTSLFLQVGSVRAEVDSSSGIKQSFQVQSPFSTASVRGTVFEFDGRKLSVTEGTVALFVGKPKRIIQKQIMRKKKEKENKEKEEAKAEEEKSKPDEEATAVEEGEEDAESTPDEEPALEEEPPAEETESTPEPDEASFLEAIEQEVEQQQPAFDDSKALFVSQGQSVEVVVALTRVIKEDDKKDQEEDDSTDGEEPEAKVLTEADTIASESVVVADTSVVSTTPAASDDAEPETPEVYIPEVTKPSQTDITIIWNDDVRGDDNEN